MYLRNELLDSFCSDLCKTSANLDLAIEHALQQWGVQAGFEHLKSLVGFCAENYVMSKCEMLQFQYPFIQFDPLETDRWYDHYHVRKSNTGISVRGKWDTLIEIDLVLLLDTIPVLFEVKTGRYDMETANDSKSFGHFFNPAHMNLRKHIGECLFKSPLASIVIADGAMLEHPSSFIRDYLFQGGYILPLADDMEKFRNAIYSKLNHSISSLSSLPIPLEKD